MRTGSDCDKVKVPAEGSPLQSHEAGSAKSGSVIGSLPLASSAKQSCSDPQPWRCPNLRSGEINALSAVLHKLQFLANMDTYKTN